MTGAPAQPGETIHHPIFARLYLRLAAKRTSDEDEYRRKLLSGLSGTVIEVGAGSGLNFPFYPAAVERVLAVEPEPLLKSAALEAAHESSAPIQVVAGVAERLPAEVGSFDAAVASLVLCSVPDQQRALAEFRRVIRPGGELRFYEHVVSRRAMPARFQRVADATFWPHVAGGCHLSRDTGAAIARAGFDIESCDRFPFAPAGRAPQIPHILGVARRP
jgi:ubiquinone/menaquinone biosynthesis C-methylase UbiE